MSTLDPAGPHAASIAGLWWTMLAGSTVLALLVFVLLYLAFRRGGRGKPASFRLWIVGLGLVMPVAVLMALLVHALVTGAAGLPTPAEGVIRVEVEARRYGWRFRLPDRPVAEEVLHIPANRPVDLAIRSTDVIHSLWVPRLAGKMDAIPGHTNVLRIVAARPGLYQGECAEYCGPGHKDHGFSVVVYDADDWAAYLANIGGGR